MFSFYNSLILFLNVFIAVAAAIVLLFFELYYDLFYPVISITLGFNNFCLACLIELAKILDYDDE